MPETLRSSRRLLAVGALATTLLGCGLAPADAVTVTPDRVAPLQEFTDYWKPTAYDTTSEATKAATVWRGTVTDQGAPILKQNDKTLVAINHAAAADTTQSHRALVDADYEWTETLPDALGPQLGQWFEDGVKAGKLPKTASTFDAIQKSSTTSPAKPYFNYPRPFLKDRSAGGQNDLNGLDDYTGITRIPDWTDSFGDEHSAEYDSMEEGRSQAFPSGHTTFAYQEGIQLAMLVPELGPEALTRSSEAGNNRIALGVHYPMDVMGGRILGHLNATAQYADQDYMKNAFGPARTELVAYLDDQCRTHGFSADLATCADQTRANDTNGYKNAFVDAVSGEKVVDRASALKAYESRMTYGFQKVGPSGLAPRVPVGAERLLTTAFPTLDTAQRRAVLAATEIDSGYVFDKDSDGWQRIDLPAAMSAKVTLDQAGKVVKVETGQKAASVETQGEQKPAPTTTEPGTPAPSDSATQPAAQPAPGSNGQPTAPATAPATTAPATTDPAVATPSTGQPARPAASSSTIPAASANGGNDSGGHGSTAQPAGRQPAAQPVSGNAAPAAAPADAAGTASTTDSGLARTGADAAGYVVGGVVFLALGTAAVVWGLRRRAARG